MAHSGIEVLFQGKNFLRLMGDLWTSVGIAGVSLGFGPFSWNFSWRFADFEKCSASSRPALVFGIFQNRSDDRAALFGLLHFAAPVSYRGFG